MTDFANTQTETPAVEPTEVGKVPPKFLEPDREIQYDIERDYLNIGANHPYFKTKWVNFVNMNGQMVYAAKSQGWIVSTPQDFPEAEHFAKVDNTIRCGDVLLMHILLDRYLILTKKEEQKRLNQQYGLESAVHEIADRFPQAFTVHDAESMPESAQKRFDQRARSTDSRQLARLAARRATVQSLGNKLSTGQTIPGVPIPGQGGV